VACIFPYGVKAVPTLQPSNASHRLLFQNFAPKPLAICNINSTQKSYKAFGADILSLIILIIQPNQNTVTANHSSEIYYYYYYIIITML
jgi:hypothetical protein